MNRLIYGILMMSMVWSLASCHNDQDPMEDGHHRSKDVKEKSVMKTVRLSFSGDFITESDEPLLRADDGKTFVGINVWRTEKNNPNAQPEIYAYALYEREENISVDLWTGYTYDFETSILIEQKDKMWGFNRDEYGIPFNTSNGGGRIEKTERNRFQYSYLVEDIRNKFYMPNLQEGRANVEAGEDLATEIGECWFPRVKRFYGATPYPFDPETSETVDIPLDYKCFGLKITVASLPSGYVTVQDVTLKKAAPDASEPTLTKEPREALVFPKDLQLQDKQEWEGIFSMNQLLASSETFKLKFVWNKEGNEKEEFESSITITPGTKKILRLNINGSTSYQTQGNINLIKGSEILTEDAETLNMDFSATD